MIDILLKDMWSPIVFIIVSLLTALVAYMFYRIGDEGYKRTRHKGEPFISGNMPPKDPRMIHVGGDNVFWGFTHALRKYLDPLVKAHTGIINDYVYWMVITMALVLIYVYLLI